MPSIRERLRAWWDGEEIGAPVETVDGDENGSPHGASKSATPPRDDGAKAKGSAKEPNPAERTIEAAYDSAWPELRVRVAQRLWGQGFVTPGGPERVLYLAKPLGLNETKHLLDFGCALGGPARALAKEFGIWVTGYESSKPLAQVGAELSTMTGMAKKVRINHLARESDFPKKDAQFDFAFSNEALHLVKNKQQLLERIVKLLKHEGEILFVDYLLDDRDAKSQALEDWLKGEPVTPHPWCWQDYAAAFAGLQVDIRINEDITDDYCRLVRQGWTTFRREFEKQNHDSSLSRAVIAESDLWVRRLAALSSGGLRVFRIHVLKRLPQPMSG
ncbi:MAG: methyltransferase domain-containing protein [Alphaproteobacteria bacterium]